MRLVIKRNEFSPKYTMGELWVDGRKFCDTIEDAVRDGKKIYGETAIPAGEYEVVITYSPRFKKDLPLLLNVKGFSGVRIHSGNTAEDSEGCIIVGKRTRPGWVSASRATMSALQKLMEASDAPITLTIV